MSRACGVRAIPQPDGRAYISVPRTADSMQRLRSSAMTGRNVAFPLQAVAGRARYIAQGIV